jgi:hypothetical protein
MKRTFAAVMKRAYPFEIERNGLRLTAIKNDPDGLPT